MPRSPRASSRSGLYHVTMRGNAKADFFENDDQLSHFLNLLARYGDECHFSILAWCLMDNHVHLVLDAYDMDLSLALRKLATAYAVYFNNCEDRAGHLFQSPFRSKPIEFEEQLVNTVRYIHKNPERAGVCSAEEYRWSSYGEYARGAWLCNTSLLLSLVGDVATLLNGSVDMDYVVRDACRNKSLSDSEAGSLLRRALGISSCSNVASMPKRDRNVLVERASYLNLPPSQLARLFGIGERTIYHILRNAEAERKKEMAPIKVSKGL